MMTDSKIIPLNKIASSLKTGSSIILQVKGKIFKVQNLISKKSNQYQLVVIGDNTGTKLIINCTPLKLEENVYYDIKIKAIKKNKYATNLFLDSAKISVSNEPVIPILDEESEWSSEHIMVKDLELKAITPVSTYEKFYENLNKEFLEEDLSVNSVKQDNLLKLEDENGKVYFYRVWAEDKTIDISDLSVGNILRFKNIDLNKQKGIDSTRNIIKTILSKIEILD